MPKCAPRPAPDLAHDLHAAAISLLRRVRAVDAEAGISAPKLSALSVLVFGGPMSLTRLAHAEQVRAPTMSKLAADLAATGLVAKRANREDRRGVVIEATAKGRKLMEAGRDRRLALLRAGLGKLTPAERATLKAAAALMLKVAE